MACENGNTFNTSLGAMWLGEKKLSRDKAEECCRSGGGSLASLTTADVVREVSEKIIDLKTKRKIRLFRLGVSVTKGVGKWNNGEDFKCEFCKFKFSLSTWFKKLLVLTLFLFTIYKSF